MQIFGLSWHWGPRYNADEAVCELKIMRELETHRQRRRWHQCHKICTHLDVLYSEINVLQTASQLHIAATFLLGSAKFEGFIELWRSISCFLIFMSLYLQTLQLMLINWNLTCQPLDPLQLKTVKTEQWYMRVLKADFHITQICFIINLQRKPILKKHVILFWHAAQGGLHYAHCWSSNPIDQSDWSDRNMLNNKRFFSRRRKKNMCVVCKSAQKKC